MHHHPLDSSHLGSFQDTPPVCGGLDFPCVSAAAKVSLLPLSPPKRLGGDSSLFKLLSLLGLSQIIRVSLS